MQDFKNLKAWNRSHDLTLAIYRATASFPTSERYGLAQQLRNAAISIESNLAEGSSRRGDLEFRRFIYFAIGSLSETECQVILSRDLKYLSNPACEQLISRVEEVRRMLCSLTRRLCAGIDESPRFKP